MFNLKIALCLISVNFYKDEKYVLSIDSEKISFPTFEVSDAKNLKQKAIEYINTCFQDTNAIELFSENVQFIAINNEYISNIFDCHDTIYLVYGVTVPNLEPNNNLFWTKFDFIDESIHNELALIGNTIERVI